LSKKKDISTFDIFIVAQAVLVVRSHKAVPTGQGGWGSQAAMIQNEWYFVPGYPYARSRSRTTTFVLQNIVTPSSRLPSRMLAA